MLRVPIRSSSSHFHCCSLFRQIPVDECLGGADDHLHDEMHVELTNRVACLLWLAGMFKRNAVANERSHVRYTNLARRRTLNSQCILLHRPPDRCGVRELAGVVDVDFAIDVGMQEGKGGLS